MKIEYRHLRWMSLIWDTELDTKSKLTAAALAEHMNANHHIAWPSIDRLAVMTSQSRSTVQRAIRNLEEAGWLTVNRQGSIGKASQYMPVFPQSIERQLKWDGGVTGTQGGVTGTQGGCHTETEGVSQGHPNQSIESVQENIHRRNFVPPDVDQVKKYCQERGNKVDAEAFVDFYDSKGWMVGKNKMKDWKAAVRTWEKNVKSEPQDDKHAAHRPFAEQKPMTKAEKAQVQAHLEALAAKQRSRQ